MAMKCQFCELNSDIRPYGPGSKMICFDCMMSTKELQEVCETNLGIQLDAIEGPIVIGTEVGPFPLKHLGDYVVVCDSQPNIG